MESDGAHLSIDKPTEDLLQIAHIGDDADYDLSDRWIYDVSAGGELSGPDRDEIKEGDVLVSLTPFYSTKMEVGAIGI